MNCIITFSFIRSSIIYYACNQFHYKIRHVRLNACECSIQIFTKACSVTGQFGFWETNSSWLKIPSCSNWHNCSKFFILSLSFLIGEIVICSFSMSRNRRQDLSNSSCSTCKISDRDAFGWLCLPIPVIMGTLGGIVVSLHNNRAWPKP